MLSNHIPAQLPSIPNLVSEFLKKKQVYFYDVLLKITNLSFNENAI